MPDVIIKIGKSIIQHGPHSQRVYLMKLHEEDARRIRPDMEQLARENHYGKIVAKIPFAYEGDFSDHGYTQEALIPEYFNKGEHAVFMAKYLSPDRKKIVDRENLKDVLSIALQRKQPQENENSQCAPAAQRCRQADIGEMVRVYRAVFETYPFPIFDPQFLSEAMQKQLAQYYCIRKNGRIAAIAAAEIDRVNRGVEMTDFATLPEFRGQGLAGHILKGMEQSMTAEGMRTAFSIARADSPAMSIVFSANGYSFGGTLGNNTNIAGRIKSMNIWYKRLAPSY